MMALQRHASPYRAVQKRGRGDELETGSAWSSAEIDCPCGLIDHEEILRQAADAYNRRDIDAVLALYDPGVAQRTILSGTARGHDGIRDLVLQQWEEFDSTIDVVEVEVLENGQVLATLGFVARAGGMEQRQELGWLISFRGERAIRVQIYPSVDDARRAAAS